MTETKDLQDDDHTIFLVSKSRDKLGPLINALSSKSIFSRSPTVEVLQHIDNFPCIAKGSVFAILFEIANEEFGYSYIGRLSSHIEILRSSNTFSDIVFIGFGQKIEESKIRDLYISGGLDLLFVDASVSAIAFGVLGLLRRIKEKPGSHRAKFDHFRYRQINILGWQFSTNRFVNMPDGQRCKLTESEWEYVKYLHTRDILKGDVSSFSEQSIGSKIRQNSLVHKIKKKLGSNFPIISLGNGRYGFEIKE